MKLLSKARYFDTGRSVLVPTRGRFDPKERKQIAHILCLGKGSSRYSTIMDIEGRVFRVFALKYDPEPKGSEERNAIRKTYRTAVAFQEQFKAAEKVLWRFPHISSLRSDLLPIVDALKIAADAPVRRGRVPDKKFEDLVKWLAKLFKVQRNKNAAITFNPAKSEFEGEFFTLVKICVAPQRQMTNAALGVAIRRILKQGTKI